MAPEPMHRGLQQQAYRRINDGKEYVWDSHGFCGLTIALSGHRGAKRQGHPAASLTGAPLERMVMPQIQCDLPSQERPALQDDI